MTVFDARVIEYPSPNQNSRQGHAVDCIVLHDTGGKTAEGALSWMASPRSEASAHYVVGRNGTVWRMVADEARAWHAGKSELWGRTDVNTFSIGIEIVDDTDDDPYPQAQLEAVTALCADLCLRHPGILLNRIVGHEHVAPGRKIDPGRDFPWRAFLLDVAQRLA
ncbi:MAG: N-acetylmuramoyl-L-alanine amidase [Candidatus Rokubacteria bacterium]|nr:N-acetylmuramoyl-L-alanine amidase [Candidatus Rokubacteria bacterium]